MRLYKRGRIYWARWSEGGRKHYRSTKCDDKKAAQLVLRRWERERADPHHAAAHQATVTSCATRLLKELKKTCRTDATFEMYECKTGHVVRLLGHVRMTELTHDLVLEYTEKREAETACPHTVHRELTALRLLLKSAARVREFGRDPKSVIPRYSPRYVPRTRWLTEDELVEVAAHLEPGRAAVLAFAVATSANFGETFRALRGDIGPTTTVRGTKRESRKRTVPAMAHTWPLLAYALAHSDGEGGLLFRPWSNMRRDIAKACAKAHVPVFTSNDLRRTCATWLVKRGVPLNLAAKVLGHSSTAMLTKVYGQLDAADVGHLIASHLGDSRGTAGAEACRSSGKKAPSAPAAPPF